MADLHLVDDVEGDDLVAFTGEFEDENGQTTHVEMVRAVDVQRRIQRVTRKQMHLTDELRGGLASIRRAQKWDRLTFAIVAILLFAVALLQTRDRITAGQVDRLMREHNQRPHDGAVSLDRVRAIEREMALMLGIVTGKVEANGAREADE